MLIVAGFWKVLYIENSHFALDTLRVATRSPTTASKINDFLGLFDDIWGVRGRLSRPIWVIPGVRAGIQKYIFKASKSQPRYQWISLTIGCHRGGLVAVFEFVVERSLGTQNRMRVATGQGPPGLPETGVQH